MTLIDIGYWLILGLMDNDRYLPVVSGLDID